MKSENILTLELDILARNMLGKLDWQLKRRIRRLAENPCEKTWDDAYCIIISGRTTMTIWQAVCELDSSYIGTSQVVDSKGKIIKHWKKIPPRELIIRAIKWATH